MSITYLSFLRIIVANKKLPCYNLDKSKESEKGMGFKMTFGKRLNQIRKEHELTQEGLSHKINSNFHTNINKGMISKWEHDKGECMLSTSKYIAQFFDISLDYLIGISDVKKPFHSDLPKKTPKIMQYYAILNDMGKHEATKRVEELTNLNQYVNANSIALFAAHTNDFSEENIQAMRSEFDDFDELP